MSELQVKDLAGWFSVGAHFPKECNLGGKVFPRDCLCPNVGEIGAGLVEKSNPDPRDRQTYSLCGRGLYLFQWDDQEHQDGN